ncbi:MAG: hypothetical protein ACYSXF_01485 [Planctomycetota bacterium]|jgi:hypothetical protein
MEPAAVPLDDEETKWPKVIGVISLIYAILGLGCSTLGGAWYAVAPMLPEMWRGGAEMPGILRVSLVGQLGAAICLGVLMLIGAVNLLRRRRAGPRLLKRWAILRMLLILIAVVLLVLTAPAQIDMQRSVQEFRNDMLRDAGRTDMIQERTDEELWRQVMLWGGLGVLATAIYPVFLGFWLSRKKITDDVERWLE